MELGVLVHTTSGLKAKLLFITGTGIEAPMAMKVIDKTKDTDKQEEVIIEEPKEYT